MRKKRDMRGRRPIARAAAGGGTLVIEGDDDLSALMLRNEEDT